MNPVFLYTSCTLTKSMPAPAHLHARCLAERSVLERFEEWRSRIDGWKGERRSARELYSGGHWSVVRDLSDAWPKLDCFVISAGYGLVSINARLAPYAATFAFGQPDSVATSRGTRTFEENVEWWNRLCKWKPVGVRGARSICSVVTKAQTAIHLVALSPFYLDAISEDLLRARQQLIDPERLIVISTGKARLGDLNGNVIPAPAQLQTVLGGGLVSLNVRVVAELLRRIPISDLTLEAVRTFIVTLTSEAKPRVWPKRNRASDAEVTSFIKRAALGDRKPSYTALLRSFRGSGRSCEMRRFRALFQNAVTKIDAPKIKSS